MSFLSHGRVTGDFFDSKGGVLAREPGSQMQKRRSAAGSHDLAHAQPAQSQDQGIRVPLPIHVITCLLPILPPPMTSKVMQAMPFGSIAVPYYSRVQPKSATKKKKKISNRLLQRRISYWSLFLPATDFPMQQ